MELTFDQRPAASLLAMRLVLATFLETPDGGRPLYHARGPLHVRAGLSERLGGLLLAEWVKHGWWSPTPTPAEGSPTESGLLHFAEVAESSTPDQWRSWFAGLNTAQVLALVGELPNGFTAVGLDPVCGNVWPAVPGLPMIRCPACRARLKRGDAEPRVLDLPPELEDLDAKIATMRQELAGPTEPHPGRTLELVIDEAPPVVFTRAPDGAPDGSMASWIDEAQPDQAGRLGTVTWTDADGAPVATADLVKVNVTVEVDP